jgi:hypothetical protein
MAARAPRGDAPIFSTALASARIEGGHAAVQYTLAQPAQVSLAIYDVAGRRVASVDESVRGAGAHRVSIPLGRIPHGIYFVRMAAAGKTFSRRLPILPPH